MDTIQIAIKNNNSNITELLNSDNSDSELKAVLEESEEIKSRKNHETTARCFNSCCDCYVLKTKNLQIFRKYFRLFFLGISWVP